MLWISVRLLLAVSILRHMLISCGERPLPFWTPSRSSCSSIRLLEPSSGLISLLKPVRTWQEGNMIVALSFELSYTSRRARRCICIGWRSTPRGSSRGSTGCTQKQRWRPSNAGKFWNLKRKFLCSPNLVCHAKSRRSTLRSGARSASAGKAGLIEFYFLFSLSFLLGSSVTY